MVSTVPIDVHYASSFDIDHPPTNALDNDETTFYMTTGLYPQEFVVKFKKPAQVTRITTITAKARTIVTYAALNRELTEWTDIDNTNLPQTPIKTGETHQLNFQKPTYGMKFIITKGWGPFTALYNIKIEGPTIREEDLAQNE